MTSGGPYAFGLPDLPIESRVIEVDGLRTHLLEAGSGPDLVLLHSGEFGGCAELSWAEALPRLATRYHVVAPDLLGFGGSAKVHDFELGYRRRLRHLAATIRRLGIGPAHYAGTSMGGTLLCKLLTDDWPGFDIRSAALLSSGGFMPDNPARRTLLDYDGSEEGMRRIVEVLFHDPAWPNDESYVRRRWELSLVPGAWETAAAARLKNPQIPPREDFGQPDNTPYESIKVPVLLVAGADDPLKEPGYADAIGERIERSRVEVIADCSHTPNIEHRERVVDLMLDFFAEVERA